MSVRLLRLGLTEILRRAAEMRPAVNTAIQIPQALDRKVSYPKALKIFQAAIWKTKIEINLSLVHATEWL